MIEKSVGFQGVNHTNDVLIVQNALNVCRTWKGDRWIAIDGLVGPETIGAITAFQQVNGLCTDGRMDVDGQTVTKLRVMLGDEALVFGPAITQLLPILDSLSRMSPSAPPLRDSIFDLTSRLSVLRPYQDLTQGLTGYGFVSLDEFRLFSRRTDVIGVAGVDDVVLGIALLAAAVALLLIMANSPAFRKAVQARAKELDRLMGELKIHMTHKFEDIYLVIEEILTDAVDESDKCEGSPGFNRTPECEEALKKFRQLAGRLNTKKREVSLLIKAVLFLGGVSHVKQIMKILEEMMAMAWELQILLQEMRDKCNCPEA